MKLGRAIMKIRSDKELAYQMSTLFHGVLMDMIKGDEAYVERLHQSQLHPYTQYLEKRKDGWFWTVTFLNEEAIEHLWDKGIKSCDKFMLRHNSVEVFIIEKHYSEFSYEILNDIFQSIEKKNIFRIAFKSPTSFKQKGQYQIFPDIRCIYQSLMNKYNAAIGAGDGDGADEEALEELCENTSIIGYHLRTVHFSLEGVKIPSFIGEITIKVRGTQTMANYANMLIKFGTFSGVGIKTALGMGAISNGEERQSDR